MANALYTIGRACFRGHRTVIVVWLLVLAALVGGVIALGTPSVSGVTIPGTESQRALESLQQEFPQASGANGTVVIRAPDGQTVTDPDGQQVVLATVAAANELPGVLGATNPYDTQAIGRDGQFALISVQFESPSDELTAQERSAFESLGQDAPEGWTIASGGEPLLAEPEIGSTEAIGVVVALLVLLITFGSLVAAGMTLLNALIGVGAGIAGITIAGHVVDMTSTTPVLALMLGLAVGIDYSLFITSRYRHNIAIGNTPEEAAGRAVGTAGSAVVFAGLTVIIALSALTVVGIPFLSVMGLAAAATVAVAVLVAITLLPALLSIAGDRVLSRKVRRTRTTAVGEDPEEAPSNGGFAWARAVIRFRVPAILVGLVAIGIMAIPAPSMQLALPDDGAAAEGSTQRIAYDLISEGFGEGANGRLVMVVNAEDPEVTAAAVQAAFAVASDADGVLLVTPPQLSEDGQTALLTIVPQYGPSDARTFELVGDLRSDLAPVAEEAGADIALTGVTAVGIDVSEKVQAAMPTYLLVVVGLSLLLLALVFRSILVPVTATVGFLLTIAATFGVTVAVFQWGWMSGLVGVDRAGPLISFLPILLIGILFGLAMDYEVFLVSRMREDYVHGESAAEAVVSGVGHGARVVVAAALIMISVFAGFVLIDDPAVKAIGFGLAIGVLIDAFIVRLTLVPAVMSFLGEKSWWLPDWLDRRMPNVDIEGESLRRP